MQDSTLIENDKSPYWNGNQLLGNPIRINSAADRYVAIGLTESDFVCKTEMGFGIVFFVLPKILLFLISLPFTVLIDCDLGLFILSFISFS